MLQSAAIAVGVTDRQHADQAFARRDERMPIADAAAGRRALDLHQAGFERHHRAQFDTLAYGGNRRQAVDRKPRPREIEVRIVAQNQRRGIRDVHHRWPHPGAVERGDRLVKYRELRVGDRTLRIAGICEQRAHALEAHGDGAADLVDDGRNIRGHDAEPGRAAVYLDVDRKIVAAGRRGGAVKYSNHRGFEDERGQIERDNLGCLFGEEAGLQIDPRAMPASRSSRASSSVATPK